MLPTAASVPAGVRSGACSATSLKLVHDCKIVHKFYMNPPDCHTPAPATTTSHARALTSKLGYSLGKLVFFFLNFAKICK